MLYRIKSATVTALALCKRGKNNKKTLFKSASADPQAAEQEGEFEIRLALQKASDEQLERGELTAVVIADTDPDVEGDFATKPVIRDVAHEFLRDHRALNIEHEGEILTDKQAYVAESWIAGPNDPKLAGITDYDGKPIDTDGAWAVTVKLLDPELRAAYRNGDWDGISLEGDGVVEPVLQKSMPQSVRDRMHAGLHSEQEDTMNEEQLKALLKSNRDETLAAVKELIDARFEKPDNDGADNDADTNLPGAPTFEGDPTNADDLARFEKSLRAHELNVALASGNLTSEEVAKLRKSVEEVEPSDSEAGVEEGDTDEVRSLKKSLFKAQKGSNQTNTTDTNARSDESEQAEARVGLAKSIASIANGRDRGPSGAKIVPKG